MQIFRYTRSRAGVGGSVAAVLALLTCSLAAAQERTSSERDEATVEAYGDETTVSGSVVSSTRNTLIVRTARGRYDIFVYDRFSTKPATIAAGSEVQVISTASDEPGVRVARDVRIVDAAARGSASRSAAGASSGSQGFGAQPSPVVPSEVRRLERDIEREARRFQTGVRAGMALDPELAIIGVQSQIGPFFNPNVFLRPNVNFGFGEVTAMFGLNLEAIYRLPITSRGARWSAYFGAGPGFNFLHQNFERNNGEGRIDFGDFKSDTGLNILGGVRFRRGTFMELKTSVYSDPAPTFRLIIGYNF